MITVGDRKLKGRGAFAQKRFVKGELIERASVVVIPAEQVKLIDQTVLTDYYYEWENQAIAIALSWVPLINHSYRPNTFYVKKFAERVIDYFAYRDIEKGEELTANYNNGSPDDLSPVWFDVLE